jgi:hypothetical protein
MPIDFLDIKNSNDSIVSLFKLGFSKQSIANSKNIYLLSERGYMKLMIPARFRVGLFLFIIHPYQHMLYKGDGNCGIL